MERLFRATQCDVHVGDAALEHVAEVAWNERAPERYKYERKLAVTSLKTFNAVFSDLL